MGRDGAAGRGARWTRARSGRTARSPMRPAPKSSLYRREVTEAAVAAVTEALQSFARGEQPVAAAELGVAARGRARPAVPAGRPRHRLGAGRHRSPCFARSTPPTATPALRDEILGRPVRLFGAHEEGTLRGSAPGDDRRHARTARILRATARRRRLDHAPAGDVATGGEPTLKLPATEVLGEALAGIAEIAYAVDAPGGRPDLARDPLRGARRGGRAALRLPQRRDVRLAVPAPARRHPARALAADEGARARRAARTSGRTAST